MHEEVDEGEESCDEGETVSVAVVVAVDTFLRARVTIPISGETGEEIIECLRFIIFLFKKESH